MFGGDYRKTTHIWNINDIGDWIPTGTSGDGHCHGECSKGQLVGACGYYRHFKALAMEPLRGPRGKGHTKEKNALPFDLLSEIATKALASHPGKVIINLCAGFQSWAPVAEMLGCQYVAVDAMGDRNARSRLL